MGFSRAKLRKGKKREGGGDMLMVPETARGERGMRHQKQTLLASLHLRIRWGKGEGRTSCGWLLPPKRREEKLPKRAPQAVSGEGAQEGGGGGFSFE